MPALLSLSASSRQRKNHRIFIWALSLFPTKRAARIRGGERSYARGLGVSYVIAGIRRSAPKSTMMQYQNRIAAILSAGMGAVVCVGEKVRDEEERT